MNVLAPLLRTRSGGRGGDEGSCNTKMEHLTLWNIFNKFPVLESGETNYDFVENLFDVYIYIKL